MARIDVDTIERIEKERNSVHAKVVTTYSVFEENGERYVQIDTYGNSDRKFQGKLSQTIQLDKESAKFLVRLLIKEFDLLS